MAVQTEYAVKTKLSNYRYTALNEKGKLVKGTIKATSEGVASNTVAERGLNLVSIQVQPPWYALDQALPSLFAVKPEELISFSRQLATLLEAGISILPALESVRQQASSRGFKRILGELINDLGSGLSFSEALNKHPAVFNEVYAKTIRVAESTGEIHVILRQLADHQEKIDVNRKKVKKALMYPAVLSVMGIGVAIILMVTVVPELIQIFSVMGTDLPIATRILIAITDFMTANQLYLLGAAVFIAIIIVYLIKQPAGRRWLDGFLLRAPVIGPALLSTELGRISRTAQVLLGSGLALQEVMELLPNTSSNTAMREALDKVKQDLIRGDGIAEPMMRNTQLFPRLLTQMVKVGEESNTLPYTLGVVADFYETNAEEKISGVIGKIAPTMTIVIAGLVGFLAMAIIMPLYQLTGSLE